MAYIETEYASKLDCNRIKRKEKERESASIESKERKRIAYLYTPSKQQLK
jgi:hypothetical protein